MLRIRSRHEATLLLRASGYQAQGREPGLVRYVVLGCITNVVVVGFP
jgi:hypothetical protein